MAAKADYREHRPAGELAPYIECYWTMSASAAIPAYRVLPDGCADLLFSRSGRRSELSLVGNMTAARLHGLDRDQMLFGVRFHPAMASLFLHAPWASLVDQTLDAPAVLGRRAADLTTRLEDAATVEEMIAQASRWLGAPRMAGAAHLLATELRRTSGQARLDGLSTAAGLSPRQMRRVFVGETGLSPKQLARILRFRAAVGHLHCADGARVAADCGYYDQAHLIHEFREFSGQTPQNFLAMQSA